MIGAGANGELTAQALADGGAHTVFVANRRMDRAIEIARRFGGKATPLEQLPERLVATDVVVSSTASPHSLISAEALAPIMARREGRPLVLIDLAVPRDIDPDCRKLEGVALYDVDDLQAVVDATLSTRESERGSAEEIVDQELGRFADWLARRELRQASGALSELFGSGASRRWADASAPPREARHARQRPGARAVKADRRAARRRARRDQDLRRRWSRDRFRPG